MAAALRCLRRRPCPALRRWSSLCLSTWPCLVADRAGSCFLDNLLDEERRGGRRQRLAAELVHDLQVVLDVRALVQVDGAGELLHVDDVRQVRFLEAKDRERPACGGVTAPGERDDLQP